MKYISFVLISYIICSTNSYDMKYSLQKHKWNSFIPGLISSGNIDIHKTINFYSGEKEAVSLKSTDLAGRVTLSDSYILSAYFKTNYATSSCLFSLERNGEQKLALCLEPTGDNALTLTLDSANIPDGKLSFGPKILENEWTTLLLAVNKTGVTLLSNCEVVEEKRFESNITNLIRLTDDMELSIAYLRTPGAQFEMNIRNLDLYTPVDVTTLVTLCPNLQSSLFRGENGDKGDKGDIGEKGDQGSKGDSGSKGDVGDPGFGMVGPKGDQGEEGPMGVKGNSGEKGEKGDSGKHGLIGIPGPKGERGEAGFPGIPGTPCPAANVSPVATAELDTLKSILSDIKAIFSAFMVEKAEQIKFFTEINNKCNERLSNAERNIIINTNNIDALKNALLTEDQT